jgi:hypothetical protein
MNADSPIIGSCGLRSSLDSFSALRRRLSDPNRTQFCLSEELKKYLFEASR